MPARASRLLAERDLIAVVEDGMAGLLVAVEAKVPGRDLDQGGAALGDAGGVPARDECADPILLSASASAASGCASASFLVMSRCSDSSFWLKKARR